MILGRQKSWLIVSQPLVAFNRAVLVLGSWAPITCPPGADREQTLPSDGGS